MTRHQRGFTLLEVMLVVLLMGLLAAAVIPNLSLRGFQAERESQQLAGRLVNLSQLAVVEGRVFGLQVDSQGWSLRIWREGRWLPFRVMKNTQRILPKGWSLQLEVDGRPASFSGETPQILLLSGGDITPFSLVFIKEGQPQASVYAGTRSGGRIVSPAP